MNTSPVTIVGNVTSDPDVKQFDGGAKKAVFSVACDHRYMGKDKEWVSDTSFFTVVCWRWLADDVERVLKQGHPVVVTGRLDQRTWETDEGNKRSVVELVADAVAVQARGIESFERKRKSEGGAGKQSSFNEPSEAPF